MPRPAHYGSSIRKLPPNATWAYSPTPAAKFPNAAGASQTEFFDRLKEWGFPTNPLNKLCHSLQEIDDNFARLMQIRAELPYDIDGIVYKVDPIALQRKARLSDKNTSLGHCP